MKTKMLMTTYQVTEGFHELGLSGLMKKRVFRERDLTPVEMDLTGDVQFSGHENKNYQFVEVKLEDLENKKYSYALPSRYFKALLNLKKNLRNFAVLIDGNIVGDVWCTTTDSDGKPNQHDDNFITGLRCEDWQIYAFDMRIHPDFQGKNLASPLQKYLQSILKSEGNLCFFGYYWNDDIKALWMHRMLKFTEHPTRKATRFFGYLKVEECGCD